MKKRSRNGTVLWKVVNSIVAMSAIWASAYLVLGTFLHIRATGVIERVTELQLALESDGIVEMSSDERASFIVNCIETNRDLRELKRLDREWLFDPMVPDAIMLVQPVQPPNLIRR